MEVGDSVAIFKTSEGYTEKGVVGTGLIVDVTSRLFRVKSKRGGLSGSFWQSNMSLAEKGLSIVSVSLERAKQIEQEIEQREAAESQRRYEEDERRRQAEYEALPEQIKLARKLKWLCECNREEKIAQIPIELLRGIIAWAVANQKENNLELE